MKLTAEQIAIINSTGNIKINAVAGSGKTTTIVEYAKTRPAESKILYLAFNKAVRQEAVKKFAKENLFNVAVETAHSLAYKFIVQRHRYKVRANGYKTNEIAELLSLKNNGEKHAEIILANHVNRFISLFCNSDKAKVQELDYLSTIDDEKAKAFITPLYDYLVMETRKLLSMMNSGEIEVTHDFYLKKFQLSKPLLNFDYILFDEGQDASAAMLDVFLNQSAVKVIVGDTNQQIYGWRFAVNSLEKAEFKNFNLSTSFRFPEAIAQLASETLSLKHHISNSYTVDIKGTGKSKDIKSKAVIARTNLGLLVKAIEFVEDRKSIKKIYFEGNINSYTYADEGASLYDILSLYNGKRANIRDPLIKSFRDMEELDDYIEKTGDIQLKMMAEIVEDYGNRIPGIIKLLKEMHVDNDEKEKADMIFSTVHRCKGMEYDEIILANDFINEGRIKKSVEDKEKELNKGKINEEINLLYVAMTRARVKIQIPDTLVPDYLPKSSHIQLLKEKKEEKKIPAAYTGSYSRSAYFKESTAVESKAKRSGIFWTPEMDYELELLFNRGKKITELANHFGCKGGAVITRLKKLELINVLN